MSDPVEASRQSATVATLPQEDADLPLPTSIAVDLEGTIAELIDKAETRYPHLGLPRESFRALLQRCLGDGAMSATPNALHVEDLYLACGYALGVESARTQVESEHFARIQRRLERMQTPAAIIADILQEQRVVLIEMLRPDYMGRGYSGRGSLGGWLYIAALRTAERRRQRAMNELPDHNPRVALDVHEQLLPVPDPEMEHLIHSYRSAFEAAMQQGLAVLSCRERNLLRYHYLERLSIDELAEIYGVHRATAARWIVRAQQRLASETRARFTAQIPMAADSMPRLLAMIRSKLNLSLSVVLQRTVEPEQ